MLLSLLCEKSTIRKFDKERNRSLDNSKRLLCDIRRTCEINYNLEGAQTFIKCVNTQTCNFLVFLNVSKSISAN